MATQSVDFNVYVGAETGLLKGINASCQQIITKNINSMKLLDRQQEITCMEWGNPEETEIIMGLRCQKVKVYDTDFQGFSGCVETNVGEGPLRGVGKIGGSIVTAAESGHVKLWRFKGSQQVEIKALTNVGGTLSKMRVSRTQPNVIATGGKKNDLQIWDLERPENPIFKARNVKNDFLNLHVPVWVSDLAFVPDSEQIAICSRHGHVRLYDPKSHSRRPVANCQPEDEAWTCIDVASRPNQVIVGSGKGRVLLFDFRQQKVVHAYRGFTGSVRQAACHPTKPIVVSVGLDRFVRVHHLDRQAPIHKIYLKSRLNAVLIRKDSDFDQDDENVWNEMEVIKEKDINEEPEVKSALEMGQGSSRKYRKSAT